MARVRRRAVEVEGLPVEALDQLHPLWRDLAALEAHPVFGPYVDERTAERLRMGGRVFGSVVGRWAVDHGFESGRWPRMVDWHALRAAVGRTR